MNKLYVLDDDGVPLQVDDVFVWAEWYEHAKEQRIVRQTKKNGVLVSTVFLGIDHSFSRSRAAPILWETLVFGGEHDGETERYIARADAVKGHDEMCQRVWANVKS